MVKKFIRLVILMFLVQNLLLVVARADMKIYQGDQLVDKHFSIVREPIIIDVSSPESMQLPLQPVVTYIVNSNSIPKRAELDSDYIARMTKNDFDNNDLFELLMEKEIIFIDHENKIGFTDSVDTFEDFKYLLKEIEIEDTRLC